MLTHKPDIEDVLLFNGVGQLAKRTRGQRLRNNTLNSLYEHLLLDRFDTLVMFESELKSHLNEVLPLFYTCIKLNIAAIKETNLETMHLIENLDDFRKSDPE